MPNRHGARPNSGNHLSTRISPQRVAAINPVLLRQEGAQKPVISGTLHEPSRRIYGRLRRQAANLFVKSPQFGFKMRFPIEIFPPAQKPGSSLDILKSKTRGFSMF